MYLDSLLEDIFSTHNNFYDVTKENFPQDYKMDDFYEELRFINERNASEQRLHQAIVEGNAAKAKHELRLTKQTLQHSDGHICSIPISPLRQFKDSALSMNTLFRKDIEQNYVPNIYINHYASRFTYLIEIAGSFDEVGQIIEKMIDTYCMLSNTFSLAAYTRPIQDCILYLELHMNEEISVEHLAKELSLTPNYLSTLFKKEVGKSITHYLLCRRISEACLLLRCTTSSIADIAASVGINDSNYFTKLFKKQMHMTPMQYRKRHR